MSDLSHQCDDGARWLLIRTTALGRTIWSCPSCEFRLTIIEKAA